MKISKIKIENFGCIQDRTFTFNKGCNTIMEHNGWGKSTLITFIKVMFYGFDGENKRKNLEKERYRFRPWQGGIYGGTIIFTVNGKEYKLIRQFGNKETEDIFALYDNKTLLESNDYSTNIGEEIFKIDSDSFRKTVLFTQNDLETGTSDSINAKLGNLTEVTDDINNYESVSKKIKDELNALTPDRATGAVSKLKDEITGLEQEIFSMEGIDSTIDKIETDIQALKSNYENAENQILKLNEEREEIAANKLNLEKQQHYRAMEEKFRVKREALDEARMLFPGEVPLEAEVKDFLEKASEAKLTETAAQVKKPDARMEQTIDTYGYIFRNGIPSEESFENMRLTAGDIEKQKQKLTKLLLTEDEEKEYEKFEVVFENREDVISKVDGMIEKWDEAMEIKNKISAKEASLETVKAMVKEENRTNGIKLGGMIIGGGVLFVVLGIVLAFVLKGLLVPGLILLGIGVLALAAGVLLFLSGKKSKEVIAAHRKNIENTILEIRVAEKQVSGIKIELATFIRGFNVSAGEGELSKALYELKSDYQRYIMLKNKKENPDIDWISDSIKEETEKVEGFLNTYPLKNVAKDSEDLRGRLFALTEASSAFDAAYSSKLEYEKMHGQFLSEEAKNSEYIKGLGIVPAPGFTVVTLEDIKQKLDIYLAALKEFNEIKTEKEAFEAKEDLKTILAARERAAIGSDETVENGMKRIMGWQKEITDQMNDKSAALETACEERDIMKEKAELLEEKIQEKEFLEKKYALLSKTKELIDQAKTSFTRRYTEPVAYGFKKYFELAEDVPADEYCFDANANLQIVDYGMPREPELYSAGMRDRISLCFRVALVDAMYKNEKPIFIMDDPFVNLDEERFNGAKKILNRIASNYQIIYMTCHDSRGL